MRTGRRTGDRTAGSGMLGRGDTALIGSLGDAVPSIHPTAWVAPGAVVVGAARIGERSLVAAGTVVLSGTAVPPGVLYAGVPGRVVRDLTDADHERFDGTPQRYARRAARHRGAVWGGEPET